MKNLFLKYTSLLMFLLGTFMYAVPMPNTPTPQGAVQSSGAVQTAGTGQSGDADQVTTPINMYIIALFMLAVLLIILAKSRNSKQEIL